MSFRRAASASAAPKTVIDLTTSSNNKRLAPPSPSPSIASTSSVVAGTAGNTPTKKNGIKQRAGDGAADIYSQPQLTGKGNEMGTQMVYAVDHLKDKDRELTIYDIIDHLTIRPTNHGEYSQLVDHLRRHPRVRWIPDSSLSEQTWNSGTYVHSPIIPGVRSKDSLLQYLQSKKDAMFVEVKHLEDGWPKERLYPAITELEREHKILVVRTKKDNHPRYIWSDDASLWHEVDPEFQNMWHKFALPPNDDINRLLLQAGQKPASEDPRNKKVVTGRVEKKKKKASKRPQKLTNTHLQGMFDN